MSRPGQIALLRFPQTDGSAGKLRPVLVLCAAPGPYDDWLVCMISSQLRQAVSSFDEVVGEQDSDFVASGLKVESVIRISRVAVVGGGVLAGAIGEIDADRRQRVRERLARWIADDAP